MSSARKYGYLGPEGTFTEAALKQIIAAGASTKPYATVTAALTGVRSGEVDAALVPIENSVEGVVARTLDELAAGEPLVITAETTLPVSFALMVLPDQDPAAILKIATHPHAEAQCRAYLARHYPKAELLTTGSTAGAAKGLSDRTYEAAIAAKVAADNYNLKIIAEDIGDNEAAVTRFVLVERPGHLPAITGRDRTSLVAYIDIDHAGALLEILTEFAKRNINLTFIQSRPTGRQLGHYHFIIDAEGHVDDEPIQSALSALRNICDDIRILGSYPQAEV